LPVVGDRRGGAPGDANDARPGARHHAQPEDGRDHDPNARSGEFLEPDAKRTREGWEHRFVAVGARADEMIELYRELGYDVVADPVGGEGLLDGCSACFGSGPEPYRSIYTRRPEDAPHGSTNMSETHPTRVLRDEHRQILQVADALEWFLDPAAQGGAEDDLDFDRIGLCIRFIRLFADACHHGKEEDLLFPALIDEGLPRDSGPIAVMLHEHRLGREFAVTMADAIDDARAGDDQARRRLVSAGLDYVGLIRGHILKEDNVLFNMADQLVAGPACTRLCEAYEGTQGRSFDGCSKAQLEELGREILSALPGTG
jgi:hemerythrin-like domain-containing protein